MEEKKILEVKNLSLSFSQYERGLKRKEIMAISNLDIDIRRGEIIAIVGSSGSGKSLLAHAILGILPENAVATGDIVYEGRVLTEKDKASIRGNEITFIPQSVNFLDPLMNVGKQIAISIRSGSKEEKLETAKKLLARYGLSPEVVSSYPHQLSGGMARKVLLCTALATESRLIIADEPTPGLDDVALQDVLKDFRDLADEGRAVLMITHDINAAIKIADRIAIFYSGTTLEVADVSDFACNGEGLRHPYSRALLRALPTEDFAAIDGTQPLAGEAQRGCRFFERCEERCPLCAQSVPEFRELRGGRVRCVNAT